jgi:hypothetical protein
MRPRRILPFLIAAALALPAAAGAAPKYPDVFVSTQAATSTARAQILTVNRWWVATHDFVPCGGCMVRPPQSNFLWTYYKRQGLFPNWVRAAREVLRRQIRGDLEGLRTGGREILASATVRRLPNGLQFRVIESAYRAPDGQLPPWRDAMSNGLVMSLIIPSLPDGATAADLAGAFREAKEYLNAFAVHWSAGGLMEAGTGRGRWYLEYAYRTGAKSRVLNGFMQSLVSLDRFARQAEELAALDPAWLTLRDRARDYVHRGAIELVRSLPRYDFRNGVSKYSLTRPGPAPLKYHVYHLQLLARLEAMAYLPPHLRAIITDYRARWGGEPIKTTLERDPGPSIPQG